ncbi:MAG TPA: prepilin-type N-terminal cleavage/methylation domain-containing protein, partial [Phycisphaerae bacterium]|nr:prepilin-type N-terminal cleavage/methylation domain-containing protein [Phycisphaerae bacterium]
MSFKQKHNTNAFTLVEMLVVVALIVLIAAIVLPSAASILSS